METPHSSGGNPADTPDPQARLLHGRYRIEKALGKGGMGEVLLAVDELLHRRVALKRMHASGEDRDERRRAMLNEARRASQINDRHIASIYDVMESGEDIVLVMEYVNGVTLRQRMAEPVPHAEFWDLATQCAEGLAAAHAHGVIHRDIKPENLMVTGDGVVKILDFGIARRTAPGVDTTASLTDMRSQGVAGTPQYMAPEAHIGIRPDERTDIFSLGVVFYELLTRHRPFEGATYGAVLEKVLNTTPVPVTDVNPAAGAELSSLVARMLARDPAQRIGSATELIKQLNHVRGGGAAADAPTPSASAVPPLGPRRRFTRAHAIAGVAVVAALGLTGLWWRLSTTAALPKDLNVAVLVPQTPGATDDFASFALGLIYLLTTRLTRHVDQPGFQLASFQDAHDENVRSAIDARKVLGANVALASSFEQGPDVLRARLELRETASERLIASRTIEMPSSKPFVFLDRICREADGLLGIAPKREEAAPDFGVQGAGTLRFYLQGVGRLLAAETAEDVRRAVVDLEVACRTQPEGAVTRAGLASAQLRIGNLAGDSVSLASAEVTARDAVRLGPERPEPHRILGLVLASRKKNQESMMEFARACDLNPSDDDVWWRLARAYSLLGQPEQQKAIFLATIRRHPHCWKPYWWLATWEFRQGNVDKAILAYDEMIRRSPQLHTGYENLGGVLIMSGDYGKAIETLKHAIELRPAKIAFENLGTAYFNTGRFTEAIDSYNQSFQFGTADYQDWINLGDAYFWLRDRKDQADSAYAQAIRLGREEIASRAQKGRPVDVMIGANLATVFPRVGKPDSARAYIDRALRSDSTNSMVQYCAALTYWQLDERDRAMAWLTRSVRGGYPTVWLRDSPMFSDWRQVAEFRTLVSAAKSEPPQAASGKRGG